MTLWAWLQVLAAGSGLMMAALALSRGPTRPLVLPLALLAVDQFTWNAASVGYELTGDPRYQWLGAIAAPLFPPMVLHFLLVFVGRRRELSRALLGSYFFFGAQALLALLDFLVPGFDIPGGISTYAVALLVPSLPLAAWGAYLVRGHQRLAPTVDERWRAGLVLLAIALVTLLTPMDLLADMGLGVPRLATLGSFAFNVILTWLVLGLDVERGSRRAALGQAVVLSLLVTSAYVVVFITFQTSGGVLLLTMSVLSLALVAGWQMVAQTFTRSRAALERYATLGRFSAQMAHDLHNPLAAARGATEVLGEELRRENQPRHQEFAGLIVRQLERLRGVIDRYGQLSRLELSLAEVDVNALVTRVLALQAFAASDQVVVMRELEAANPRLSADAELLSSALENLVRNALEAMPARGTLTVRTSVSRVDAGHFITLSVRDTGVGMDARTREQAFAPMFTTKPKGSGLGLAFVRQVARAHGGEVFLDSREGSGTLVELRLPASTVTGSNRRLG